MFTIEVKAALVGCLLLYLMGCGPTGGASSTAEPQTPPVLRMDLPIKVNGVKGVGMLVVPRAASYVIEVQAPGDPEQVLFSTCHRDTPMGKQDDKFTITFTPVPIELEGHCQISITALGQKFTYAGAAIEIADSLSLSAKLYCNGAEVSAKGAAVCQSRERFPQQILFDGPVDWVPQVNGCPDPEPLLEGKKFEIALGKGLCTYSFQSMAFPYFAMRLVTHGYNKFLGVK